MNRKIGVILVFSVFLCSILSAAFNVAKVKAVNGDPVHNLNTLLNYTTIQAAINDERTLNGHTILVDEGTYNEHVVVNKSLSLVGQDKSTTIVDGSGNGTVITITEDHVNVTGFTIQNSGEHPENGFYLDEVSHCNITGNNIFDNLSIGLRISDFSANNTISRNVVKNNTHGISLRGSLHNVYGNNVTGNRWGVSLYDSSYNTIYGNNITDNSAQGLPFYPYSENNTVHGNNITGNHHGIYFNRSANNSLHHNNVIDNIFQVWLNDVFCDNVWDNGVEGNFWSNYTGSDSDQDGIGDTPHVMDGWNQDRYPLIAPVNTFSAEIWDEYIHVVSNSTVSEFVLDEFEREISFSVDGNAGVGFCRVTIPNIIIQDLWMGEYTVLVDGQAPLTVNSWTDSTHTYIYFTYQHSIHEVVITPEFPWLIIVFLTIAASLLTILNKRKRNLT